MDGFKASTSSGNTQGKYNMQKNASDDFFHFCFFFFGYSDKRLFKYKLETLVETREVVHKGSIHRGEVPNVPENSDFGDPWDVPVDPENGTPDFSEFHLTKPGSVSLRECENCLGKKVRRCFACWGSGDVPCHVCNGRGMTDDNPMCKQCDGSGKSWCMECCFGRGAVECQTCKGNGKMLYEKQLVISRKVQMEDFVSNSSTLPANLFEDSDGWEVFRESARKVNPLRSDLSQKLSKVSSALIAKHSQLLSNEKIIAQRHILREIPFTKVFYTWNNKKGEFYIYGLQKKVYFKDYPQRSLCVCS